MLIASTGGISYVRFATALVPVALGAMAIVAALLVWRYRPLLRGTLAAAPEPEPVDRALLGKTLVVSALLLAALLVGVAPPLAALAAASVLLITRRVDPARVYALIDWPLLILFAGLFVVVEAVQRTGLAGELLAVLSQAFTGPYSTVAVVTALSNLVSNVPAVLLLSHATATAPDPEHARLVLAMASTLAGNLTLVGSVANLVVVSQAGAHARVGFWEYARIGLPITLLSLAWGIAWLR
jgi:Na+/H+ antiporter NhaD/arsenite permease-like protein